LLYDKFIYHSDGGLEVEDAGERVAENIFTKERKRNGRMDKTTLLGT
jgi:hypothetical protein